ncbi:hypothetical protein [Streptomyces boninensis]|uniref:hypothetical protein n=1 Tax=Streptomyces boninensis TaxID=2039455 RepID=UPI003B215B97
MSAGVVVILAFVIAVVVALMRAPTILFSKRSLRRRFGPEFERALAEHDGDSRAACKELSERLHRHGDVREQVLPAAERERFLLGWAKVQVQFAHSPGPAVVAGAQLLRHLAADRGYPADDDVEQVEALSVRYADDVAGMRRLYVVAERITAGAEEVGELTGVLAGAQPLFHRLAEGGVMVHQGRLRRGIGTMSARWAKPSQPV